MSNLNPALEAAVIHFGQQPGVTPSEVDQLRATLASDPALTQSLEKSAASGALEKFAPSTPGAPNQPVGHYDPANRTMTLPKSAFTPNQGISADLHGVLRVQSMVSDFAGKSFSDAKGAKHPATPDMVANLQETMNGSPVLAEELKRAATTLAPAQPSQPRQRILESFDFTAPGAGVGGSFSPSHHTMNLVSESLMTTPPPGSNSGGFRATNLTFVIGHEVQHGFNAQAAEQERSAYIHDVRALASTPGPVHDYTALVERYIQSGREDEARAEIAGWNALRDRVQHDDGSVTLTNLRQAEPRRVNDFLEIVNGKLGARSNLHLNTDLSIDPTPNNVAAMGHNYFDRTTSAHHLPGDSRQDIGLGVGNQSDYPNYYAGWAIAVIAQEERAAAHGKGPAPQIQINMKHIGLYEDMIEKGGLDLSPGKQTVPYLDSSTQPATPHRFDHTADGPHQYQYVPVAPIRLDDPAHPDHALYQQVRGHIVALDQSLGRTPDMHTDQLASAVTVQARADGLQRIDQVALSTDGQRLWSVQTPPGRTDHLFDLRTSVPTAEAMTPMEQSGVKWPEAIQQFQQAQQQQQAQAQYTGHNQTQAQGPVMTHGLPGTMSF